MITLYGTKYYQTKIKNPYVHSNPKNSTKKEPYQRTLYSDEPKENIHTHTDRSSFGDDRDSHRPDHLQTFGTILSDGR